VTHPVTRMLALAWLAVGATGCKPSFFLVVTEPTPVFAAVQAHPEGLEAAVAVGEPVVTLAVGDCVEVVDVYDSKEPSGFKVALPTGEIGWLIWRRGAFDYADACPG
jgi:hypothetical protein